MEIAKKSRPRNKNLIIRFLKENQNWNISQAGIKTTISRPIFSSQKELVILLSQIPETRFGKAFTKHGTENLNFESKISSLSMYLNGRRLRTRRNTELFKKELFT